MDIQNQKLDELWVAYREVLEVPEASAHFAPKLWGRIDGQRAFTLRLKRLSRIFAGSAAVICLLLTGIMVAPSRTTSQPASYLDVLAEALPLDNLAAQGIAHTDHPELSH